MKIWKYDVPIESRFEVMMPVDAKAISVQMQDGQPRMWALIDETNAQTWHLFHLYGTGQALDAFAVSRSRLNYVGTFQAGFFVWHLFQEMGNG